MATKKLLVKIRSYSKLVATNDFANLYDIAKTTYKAVDSFPANFTLKFEDKEFGFIDLDRPVQLTGIKTNILMVSEPESELSNIVRELNKNRILPNLASSPARLMYVLDVFYMKYGEQEVEKTMY